MRSIRTGWVKPQGASNISRNVDYHCNVMVASTVVHLMPTSHSPRGLRQQINQILPVRALRKM